MAFLLDEDEIAAADRAVEQALRVGSARGLPVIGHGEISTVLAWPPSRPRTVVKRLPTFASIEGLQAYRRLLDDYVSALAGRGVEAVETQVWATEGPSPRAFLLQPLQRPELLVSNVLSGLDTGPEGARALAGVVDLVLAAVDASVGLDAQVSNWAVSEGGALRYLDVSTPFLRDAAGRDRLDLTWLTSVYAAAARPLIRRAVAPGVMAAYHDPRRVLVDLGANLHREGLQRHVPALIAHASLRGVPLTEREIRGFYLANTRTWRALRGMRRADVLWQRHVRRRPYSFLLPEDTA